MDLKQFEELIERLNNASTDDEIHESTYLLINMYRSFVSNYEENKNDLTNLVDICNICLNQIQKSQNLPPADPILQIFIRLASFSTYHSHDLNIFEQFQNLSPNILIYYYDYLLKEEIDIRDEEPIIYDNIELYKSIAFQADICDQTFSMLKKLFKIINDYDNQYLPLIQSELQNSMTEILEFFEDVLQSGYEDNYEFIKNFISILTEFTDQMYNTKQITIIWSNAIDKTFEFYLDPIVGTDFTISIFEKFRKIQLRMIDEDIESFYQLYNIYSSCVKYVPDGCEAGIKPFVLDFLQFTLELFESHLSVFQNEEMITSLNYFFCSDLDGKIQNLFMDKIIIPKHHNKLMVDL